MAAPPSSQRRRWRQLLTTAGGGGSRDVIPVFRANDGNGGKAPPAIRGGCRRLFKMTASAKQHLGGEDCWQGSNNGVVWQWNQRLLVAVGPEWELLALARWQLQWRQCGMPRAVVSSRRQRSQEFLAAGSGRGSGGGVMVLVST
eukprot:g47910.t1